MKLLFEYLSLLALVIIAFVPEYTELAQYFLAGGLTISATMFYLLMLQSILGLQSVGLNTNIDLGDAWQTRAITSVSAIALHLAGFTEVLFYILPFIIIGTLSDIMATLIVAGIVEIDDDDYEEEEEDEEEEEEDKPDKR
jgi:hypothetical protein